MSDSNACYTRSSGDGCSTLRIGAAWPLSVRLGLKPPTVPFAHFGNRIVAERYETTWNQRFRLNSEIIPEELESWKVAVKYASEGVAILNTIENPNDNLMRLILLCRYIECQCKSAVCAKKWVLTKQKLDMAKKEDKQKFGDIVENHDLIKRTLMVAAFPALIKGVTKDGEESFEGFLPGFDFAEVADVATEEELVEMLQDMLDDEVEELVVFGKSLPFVDEDEV
jgi:hypothetical protein